MTTRQFPKNFLWGAASSAPQSEGANRADGKGKNIWDHWHEQEPEKFFNQVGPTDTSKVYEHYKADVALMKQLGFNSYRTSISWARLFPTGEGEVNEKAVTFYNAFIDELIANGIEPMINLYHFDMPFDLQERGGWENREVVEAYACYAKKAFELFGDRVKYWFTCNEPIVPIEGCYLYQWHYPCIVDMKRAVQAAYNCAIANAKAVKAYKALNQGGQIGVIISVRPIYPATDRQEDVETAKLVDLLFNRSFLDPLILGHYPQELIDFVREQELFPEVIEGDKALLAQNTVDILGMNYYTPKRVKARETAWTEAFIMPEAFYEDYEWPERKINPHRGWEIYEKGMYDICIRLRDEYGNIPWFVSENGMGVENEERFMDEQGMIHDDYRIEFLTDHLEWLHKGIEEGANCFGYHMWTFIDNWSWLNAYKNRYGFYRLDLENNHARVMKKSGLWFYDLATTNTLKIQEEE